MTIQKSIEFIFSIHFNNFSGLIANVKYKIIKIFKIKMNENFCALSLILKTEYKISS
jgi:hypothetical protein